MILLSEYKVKYSADITKAVKYMSGWCKFIYTIRASFYAKVKRKY